MNTTTRMDILYLKWTLFLCLLISTTNSFGQQQRKQRVDTFRIALKMEFKKHLYPTVDSLTTEEMGVFVVFPHVKPNASLRLIEKNGKAYIETRILYKNVSDEVLTAFKNHKYKELTIHSDSFTIEVSNCFKTKMLDAFRKTVNQKFVDLYPKKIEIYDGTNFKFWINEDSKSTSINIREDIDSRFYGWKFAKTNLQIIDDIKKGVFEESKYKL